MSIPRRYFLAAGVVLLAAISCLAGNSADLKSPVYSLDIGSLLPPGIQSGTVTVRQFRVGSNGVYYCVSPGPAAKNSVILKTDWNGKRIALVSLPADKPVLDFDVDEQGAIYVLLDDFSRSSLALYTSAGILQSTTPIGHFASGITLVKGHPVLTKPDSGSTHLEVLTAQGTSDAATVPVRNSPRPALATLPDGRVLLGERSSGIIYLVDTSSRQVTSLTAGTGAVGGLSSPNTTTPRLGILSFGGAATSPEGDIYVISGRYKLAEGAPITRLNPQGTIIEQIHCLLPTFDAMKNVQNPQGYMSPFRVRVSKDSIILVSLAGQIAGYARH
jgi:hypothetical protein